MSAVAMKYDAYVEHVETLENAELIVCLMYDGFCDPCRSTKPHLEALALQYGFHLVRVDGQGRYDPERAGEDLPHVTVHRTGQKVSQPLTGAQTRSNILKFLIDQGVIVP